MNINITFNDIKNEVCLFHAETLEALAQKQCPLMIAGLFSKSNEQWYYTDATSLNEWYHRSKKIEIPATTNYPDRIVFYIYQKTLKTICTIEASEKPDKTDFIPLETCKAYPYLLAFSEHTTRRPAKLSQLEAQIHRLLEEQDEELKEIWVSHITKTLISLFPLTKRDKLDEIHTIFEKVGKIYTNEDFQLCLKIIRHAQGYDVSIDYPTSILELMLAIETTPNHAHILVGRLLTIDPDNLYALFKFSQISPYSIKTLLAVLKPDTNRAIAFAEECFLAGNQYVAHLIFKQVEKQDSTSLITQHYLGEINKRLDSLKLAEQYFQKAVELGSSSQDDAHYLHRSLFCLARLAYDAGNYDKSVEYCREVIRCDNSFFDLILKNFPRAPEKNSEFYYKLIHSLTINGISEEFIHSAIVQITDQVLPATHNLLHGQFHRSFEHVLKAIEASPNYSNAQIAIASTIIEDKSRFEVVFKALYSESNALAEIGSLLIAKIPFVDIQQLYDRIKQLGAPSETTALFNGLFHISRGKKALKNFIDCLNSNPKNKAALAGLAGVLRQQGDVKGYTELSKIWFGMEKGSSLCALANIYRFGHYGISKNYAHAQTLYTEAWEREQETLALEGLANLYLIGDTYLPQDLEKSKEYVLRYYDRTYDHSLAHSDIIYSTAQLLLKGVKIKLESIFSNVSEQSTFTLGILLKESSNYYSGIGVKQDFEKAKIFVKASLVLDNKITDGYALLGDILRQEKKYNEAQKEYFTATTLKADCLHALAGLAEIALSDNDINKAEEILRPHLDLHKFESPLSTVAFKIELARKDNELFKKYRTMTQNTFLESNEELIKVCQFAIDNHYKLETQWAEALWEVANSYIFEKALPFMQMALKIDSNHTPTLNMFGRMYHLNQQYDLAIESFNKALSVNKEHVDSLTYLADIYLHRTQHKEKGAEYLKQAVELAPEYYLLSNLKRGHRIGCDCDEHTETIDYSSDSE